MAFGRGSVSKKVKNMRMTQRSNALRRIAEARSASVARRISRPHSVTQRAKVMEANRAKVMEANRAKAKAPALRENQDLIDISIVNNKLNKLLELLKVDDPNTNIIMTFEQLNVRLDTLIESLETKKKEAEKRDEEMRKEKKQRDEAMRKAQSKAAEIRSQHLSSMYAM
jgi:hypothetical protein